MGLDQSTAILGFKFSSDRVKEPIRQLSTMEDYQFAIREIQ